MLFIWMPVPGTITPEPEPVDADSEAALPEASTTEMCVVPPGERRLGCTALVRLDAPERRPHVPLGEEVRGEPATLQPGREAGPHVLGSARA